MEESRVGIKIETGAEDVDIKHEPLEPYVEYLVSLYDYIFHFLLQTAHFFFNSNFIFVQESICFS